MTAGPYWRWPAGPKKPIVLFKSNVSRSAAGVAMSHTAALSNDDRIADAAMKQAGIIRVERHS